MGSGRALIERYIWRTIVPYFFLAWFLLTAILLLQQASRFSDILFGSQIPTSLIWELLFALLPNILAFTSPMALFAGVMVGLGQMQGDSELIAFRAAGVSNFRVLLPSFFLGLLLTILTLYINFEGVPKSAQLVRQVGVKAALAKLESPLEPGVFNNEIPKYVIYTRDGNREKGVWERVFIHAREKNGELRLITAKSGKIDSAGEQSELVLQDAIVTTLNKGSEIALERVNSLRVALDIGRRQLLDKLQKAERSPEEMGLTELAAFSEQKSGKEKRDAQVLWHRRVSLAFAPLVFSILGVALGLRYARGGRGYNAILALVTLISYYLVSLLCEQMSRAGSIPVFLGSWASPSLAVLFSGWLLSKGFWKNNFSVFGIRANGKSLFKRFFSDERFYYFQGKGAARYRFDLSGLLNRDIVVDLLKYFAFSTGVLLFLYLVFTSFELWRFAASTSDGFEILGKYLLYISPIVVFQVAPSALLLAILFVYGIRSKRSEIIAWNSAGQNVFRLLIPAFFFSGLISWGAWALQDNILPQTNKRQDALRAQLKGGASAILQEGRFWFAEGQHVYSFVADKNSQTNQGIQLKEVEIYNFGSGGHLNRLLRAGQGILTNGEIRLNKTEEVLWKSNLVEVENRNNLQAIALEQNIGELGFSGAKFFYATLDDLKERLKAADSVSEQRRLKVAVQKYFIVMVLPPIIVLFAAPFALAFGRRGNNRQANLSLFYVFGLWLGFMGFSAFFEQLGNSGLLTDLIAVWSPLFILASIGTYLIARTPN
ncbi:MAG: LptF/LptG family permease [Acidobacteriota bacterium]|nr:LptF/LptG family permease [Acidobacteriota bacterium]